LSLYIEIELVFLLLIL